MVWKNSMKKDVIIIIGPTASGKSDLAIKVAKNIGGQIISADSSQVYKDLNIGSAKINCEEMQGIKHYMIDIKSPFEDFSVAEFKELSLKYIQEIIEQNKIPIICGGTGLYVKSLINDYDFSNAPKQQKIRDELEDKVKEFGLQYVYNLLKKISPEKALKINPNDKIRIIRALEIELSQISIKKDADTNNNFNYYVYAIDLDRQLLYQKINYRVDEMVKRGLFDEVKQLMDKGVTIQNSCFKSIGYKEVYDYFKNATLDKEQTIELIKKKTRNYAKRQLTFFRGMKQTVWLSSDDKLTELLKDFKNRSKKNTPNL